MNKVNNIKHDILNIVGAEPRRKRVGRGSASGYGRTSGRGHEGQRSRGNIPVSFMLKDALKVRKIRQVTGINNILYKTFDITSNMLDESLIAKLNKIKDKKIFRVEFEKHFVKNNLANDISQAFNIPFYYKRTKIVGFGSNNFYIKLR